MTSKIKILRSFKYKWQNKKKYKYRVFKVKIRVQFFKQKDKKIKIKTSINDVRNIIEYIEKIKIRKILSSPI